MSDVYEASRPQTSPQVLAVISGHLNTHHLVAASMSCRFDEPTAAWLICSADLSWTVGFPEVPNDPSQSGESLTRHERHLHRILGEMATDATNETSRPLQDVRRCVPIGGIALAGAT